MSGHQGGGLVMWFVLLLLQGILNQTPGMICQVRECDGLVVCYLW